MKKLIKVLASLVGIVVVLLVVAVVVVSMTFDPNDYREQVVSAVKEHTGRDLRIEGNIELTVFPWLGVTTGVVELGNASGFDGDVFARTEKVNVRVKLMPLLGKEVVMDTVTVHGLALNLAVDEAGRTNWDDLAKGGEPAKPEGEGPGIAALAVGGLDIRDASLSWRDATSGQRFAVTELDARTGALAPGKPIDLDVSFQVDGGPPGIAGRVALSGTLDMNPDSGEFNARDLTLEADLTGEQLPGGKASLRLAANVAANTKQHSVHIRELELSGLGLDAKSTLSVTNYRSAPKIEGELSLSEFDLKALMAQLGQPEIQTTDPKALTNLSLTTKLSGTPQEISLSPLSIRLDETSIDGSLTAGPPAKARFELRAGAIDADRYLPPKSGTEAASPGAAATGATDLPVEQLRSLDVDGTFELGALKIANLNLSDISLKLKAKDGLIQLSPIAATLYEGSYSGSIGLDARGETPKLSVEEKLAGIQAGPLLEDLQGEDRLTGTGNVEAKLTAAGTNPDAMKQTLNGTAAFSFTDGAVNGINIPAMIREARAKLLGGGAGEAGPQKTDFSELSGSFKIVNGLATNDDLSAKSPLLRVEGAGQADIPKETIDYRVRTTVVATTEGQGGGELAELAGVPIPIHVTGTFGAPKYRLDMESLAGELAKAKGTKALTESAEKLLEGSGGAAGDVTEKAGETLKGVTEGAGGLIEGLIKKKN